MLKNIKDIVLKDTKIQIVGIHVGSETTYQILNVNNKKNQLSIQEKIYCNGFDDVADKLNKKYPVLLAFSGKGILIKKVKKEPDYKSKILLNVNINDFYFYEHHVKEAIFVSVARKEVVERELNLFKQQKYLIVDYSIGPFISFLLKPFTNSSSIPSYNIRLEFSDHELNNFSREHDHTTILIGQDNLAAEETALYATAINYYFPNPHLIYERDFLKVNIEEKKYKKIFEILGSTMLIGFFVSLLISYLLLGYYNEKRIQNNSSLELLQETYQKIGQLEKERDDKRAILNESGVFTSNFLSFYINELTQQLPETIQLKTFQLFPENKKIKQAEKITFKSNQITIKGESFANTKFNSWYKKIKKIPWVIKTETDIVKYKANKNNGYDFEIKIAIK